jgi:hypothetical protein
MRMININFNEEEEKVLNHILDKHKIDFDTYVKRAVFHSIQHDLDTEKKDEMCRFSSIDEMLKDLDARR